MRRAPVVLTATVAGVAAVLNFHAHAPTATAGTATAAVTSTANGQTADGDVVPTGYGNAQVRVTVDNGEIVDVVAPQLQGSDPKSVQISGYAAPLLRQSALAKQSADIDAVSGATYTSESYKQSLQSALDRLGF